MFSISVRWIRGRFCAIGRPCHNESMVWSTSKEKIKRLSQRIVEAQKPIRILDAIKWDPSIEAELKKSKYKRMPLLGPEYYQTISLGFDPDKKKEELSDIINDISATLGTEDSIGI